MGISVEMKQRKSTSQFNYYETYIILILLQEELSTIIIFSMIFSFILSLANFYRKGCGFEHILPTLTDWRSKQRKTTKMKNTYHTIYVLDNY